jgi:hypothetical protein
MPDAELPETAGRRGGREVRIELRGPLGCLAGVIMLAIAVAILLVAAFAGLIAVAAALWIGAAFLAIAIIAALIRGRL